MMDWLFGVDWRATSVPQTPPLEIVARGSVIYLALFVLLRPVLKRESGAVGITDLLVVVLLADAAQNAMADDYASVPDGVLLLATILFWSHALNWLSYRVPLVGRLVHPQPLPLVADDRPLRRNTRREQVTEGELLSQLRLQGVEEVGQVKVAYMEGDGRISVVGRDGRRRGPQERWLGRNVRTRNSRGGRARTVSVVGDRSGPAVGLFAYMIGGRGRTAAKRRRMAATAAAERSSTEGLPDGRVVE